MGTRGNRYKQFAKRVEQYELQAAQAATDESKAVYTRWLSARPRPPARPGRATTGGTLVDLIQWVRVGNGTIEFDYAGVAGATPTRGPLSYALIQEIGTGQTANIFGRGTGSLRVPSQMGRRISPSLMWSDGVGSGTRPMTGRKRAALQKAGSFGMQNLFERPAGSYGRAGLIRKEIRGKHYIRDGGKVGWELLRESLLKDVRLTYK